MKRKYQISEEARILHYSSFVADLHADSPMLVDRGYDMFKKHEPKLPLSAFFNHVDIPRMIEGGISLQAFGIVTNYWVRKERSAKRKVEMMWRVVEESPDLEWALSGSEAEKVWRSGKIGVFLGMEGVHPLEGDIKKLQWFYDNGLRYASLTHFNNTEAAYSSATFPWNRNKRNKGLKPFGKELITAMDDMGIIVDLAHINYGGFFDAVKLSKNPVIVSHGTVKSLSNHSRSFDDKQIKAIANKDGVMGIMFLPLFLSKKIFEKAERIIDHIDAVKSIAGIDYVSLGSDFDGCIYLPSGIRDVRDLPVLTQLMLDRGYSHEEVKKVLGLNFLRVYKQVCG